MPIGDKTGPEGQGPRTGRGLEPGYNNDSVPRRLKLRKERELAEALEYIRKNEVVGKDGKVSSLGIMKKTSEDCQQLRKLGFEKNAILAVGGRKKDYGKGKAQFTAGYTNLLGIIPTPAIGVRIGKRDKTGVSLLSPGMVRIDSRASNSFKDRPKYKGLSDLLLEKMEDKKKAKK